MSRSKQQQSQPDSLSADRDYSSIFNRGGEMGALMRAYNWDEHPLGNPEHWPQSLKSNIRLLLNSGFPMFIWWSRELYAFHNDAYIPALGEKHPQAMGTSAKVIWAEIWDQLSGLVNIILEGGDSFYKEALYLPLERKGYSEETYWTFSYSGTFDDEGNVGGVFCACQEVTSTVLSQRRLKTLKDVSDATTQMQTLEQACQTTCDILTENYKDIPFSLIYLLNKSGTEAQLLGTAGMLLPEAAPHSLGIKQSESNDKWPLAKAYQSRQVEIFDFVGDGMVTATESIPQKAVIVPIFQPGQDVLLGFFLSGIGIELEYNLDYQNFHELLAGHIATAITSIQGRVELAQQKEFLIELFEQAPVGITILHGPEHVIELANHTICGLWGKSQVQVLGKPVLDAIPEVREQGIKQLLDEVLNTGVPYVNNELPLVLERNGVKETVYFNFVYQPMRNSLGYITGVIAVAVGINEQVEARHKIEAINKELLAINADLDNFVYAASHDLKAPISNIEGLMLALRDNLPEETLKSQDIQHLFYHIQISIDRFKRSVTDLTQVARLQRESENDTIYISIPEVVADVKMDFESLIVATNARIVTSFAENSSILFSAKNVRSIVYNFISNALKYRSPDRQPHIIITTENTPEYLILTVADNGLGVESSNKSKMFTMFKRLHDHVEGTGVGLYIVKRIVENAGGRIEVESEPGQGTTFRVYLRHA